MLAMHAAYALPLHSLLGTRLKAHGGWRLGKKPTVQYNCPPSAKSHKKQHKTERPQRAIVNTHGNEIPGPLTLA